MVKKPIVVMIRDGWGFREEEDHNGPHKANVPYRDLIMEKYPSTLIDASGEAVGLFPGVMGNSEVGHMTIGSGRIIKQMLVRISDSIKSGEFHKNEAFINAIAHCKKEGTALHIMGLLQTAAVHSHKDHLFALLDVCKQQEFDNVLLHIFSDGRDSEVQECAVHMKDLLAKMKETGVGNIVSLSGRYYAMDRDKRWERTQKAYDCIIKAKSDETFTDVTQALQMSYGKGITDEFIVPVCAEGYDGVKEKDAMIFFNYRTDRPRQLTKAIIEDEFEGWERSPLDVHYVGMTQFYTPMNKRAVVAFPEEKVANCLGEVLANAGLKQLRISETEKYAHVTFFFNGQNEEPYAGEDRILIPSPKVATYDLKPEMSVHEIGERLVDEIDKDLYDVIVVNLVNGDMVGHTGVWEAVVAACEAVDQEVKRICEKVLEKDGITLVFADHGNCEEEVGKYTTTHTTNPVHFIVVSNDADLQKEKLVLKEGKGLQDVAPTVLKLLEVEKPDDMGGDSII